VVAVVVVVVIVEVITGAVVVVVVVIVEVAAGWVTVEVTVVAVPKVWVEVVEVVALLQALNTEVATSSNAVKTMSHFLLNLPDNFISPFSYFLHYKRPSLRRV